MLKTQKGFSVIEVLVALILLGVIGFVGWTVFKSDDSNPEVASTTCPAQPMMASPADVSLATSVLYPGQTRGGDYKPHGGLRFDTSKDNQVVIKAPMDANLTSGSRYIEQGEVQTLLEFSNPCGAKYRFDHLLTLSPKFQKVVEDSLPPAKPDDSRTTDIKPEVSVKKDEIVATAIGFAKTKNVGFDFGVYDYRTVNGTNLNGNDLAQHGVCWLRDWLPTADSAKLLTLPGGDSKSGKTSDYC